MIKKFLIKTIIGLMPMILVFMILISPIIMAGAVIGAPFEFLSNLFQEAGDLFTGNDDITRFLDDWFAMDEANEVVMLIYQPRSLQQGLQIPVSYFMIPAMIAGMQEPPEAYFQAMIKAAISEDQSVVMSSLEYCQKLKNDELWKPLLETVSVATMSKYIDRYLYIGAPIIPWEVLEAHTDAWMYPFLTKKNTTDEFGWRILVGESNYHGGIDIAASCGTPVYATHDGVVNNTQTTSPVASSGNYVAVRFTDKGITYTYIYKHLQHPVLFEKGKEVKKGDFLGYVGNTGLSYGCHLHFEIQVSGVKVNPGDFVDFTNPKLPKLYQEYQQK